MREILDTNVFISYLLGSTKRTAIRIIIEAALAGHFKLLLSEELVAEFARKVSTKPYLAARVTDEQAARLIDTLSDVSEIIPRIKADIPAIVRDQKDDYLLAYAVAGQADYLVTGDEGLLSSGEAEHVRIVTPLRFVGTLRDREYAADTE